MSPMRPLESKISLPAMRLYAYHGVLDQERVVGNWFTVSLTVWTDIMRAAESDSLEHALNYAELFQTVAREMGTARRLLESVVYHIAECILEQFPTVDKLEVTLTKEYPPFKSLGQGATVSLLVAR